MELEVRLPDDIIPDFSELELRGESSYMPEEEHVTEKKGKKQ